MLTIPNILTLSRIALLPFLVCFIYAGQPWVAFVIYCFCAITDFLDGYLARKMNAVSAFGTFLDPIADKIFVALLLVVLVDVGALSGLWIIPVLIILTREFFVAGLREFLGQKDIKMPVTGAAKWKTTVQMLALGLLIIAPVHILFLIGGLLLISVAAFLTAYTGLLYLKASWVYLQ